MGEKSRPESDNTKARFAAVLPWLLVIGGIIGIASSMILVYDQIQIWKNPHFLPTCNLNPIVNCGTVIHSNQGDIFGIPAPFFGLLLFPALLTIGISLFAGATYRRWFWRGLQVGATGGVVFALWLYWLSLYRVHALCPFCLAVDTVVYTAAWYITLYNLSAGNLGNRWQHSRAVQFVLRHHLDVLLLWFVLITVVALKHFWYFFGSHL